MRGFFLYNFLNMFLFFGGYFQICITNLPYSLSASGQVELRNIVIEASHADFTGISLQHLNQACIQVNNFQKVFF